MRKPLVCMRGFRGRGWGDRGGVWTLPVKIQTLILHIFFYQKQSSHPTPPPSGKKYQLFLEKILDEFMYLMNMRYIKSYVSSINLNTAILIEVGVSICFVSFDNFPFIFLLTVWLFVRIAFIQYVNVWKSLILVIFKREKLLNIIG